MSEILNEEKVIEICKLLEKHISTDEICKNVGCSSNQINSIRYRRSYTDISKNYNFKNLKLRYKERESEKTINAKRVCELLSQNEKPSDIELQLMRENNGKKILNRKDISNIKCRKTYLNISKDYKW